MRTSEHSPNVCAVLRDQDRELQGAVTSQERLVDFTALFSDRSSPAADWIWLLDGTALPNPDTLAALLAAAQRLDPVVSPIILASTIVGAAGRLAPAHVPLAPQGQTEVAVRTVGLRVLPVRAVTGGSLLVRPEWMTGSPRPGVAPMIAWTARHLRDGGGFLVPSSVARARSIASPRWEQAALFARLVFGSALHPKERLRFATDTRARRGVRT